MVREYFPFIDGNLIQTSHVDNFAQEIQRKLQNIGDEDKWLSNRSHFIHYLNIFS